MKLIILSLIFAVPIIYLLRLNIQAHRELDKTLKEVNKLNEELLEILNRK